MPVEVDQAVGRFVQDWFDLLSRHAPVAQILPYVADDGLEMVFPERTLRSHRDFVDWYAVVGATYADQEHVVEDLQITPRGGTTDVRLTVVWRARQVSDGSLLAVRVHQSWQLTGPAPAARPVIAAYRVLTMDPV